MIGEIIEGEPGAVAEVEPEPAPEFVPLTEADIALPEGFTADPELQTEFLTLMNDQEMDAKSRAQGLVELQAKLMTKASEASSAAWDEMQTTWQNEVKADPVIGGEKMKDSLATVSKLVSEYGSDELVQVMGMTGAGNNIHVIKFLHTLAGKLTEGGYTQGQPAKAEGSAASRMYPSMKG